MFAQERLHDIPDTYHGVILLGTYSPALKQRVAALISQFQAMDALDTPVIPYISAWKTAGSPVWHEFSGKALAGLLGCDPAEVSPTLRRCLVDRCIYSHPHLETGGGRKTMNTFQLHRARTELRAEVMRDGQVEAVYKLAPPSGRVFWLKDQARIETHPADGICLSLGMLSVVTKEMETEEALVRAKEELQAHRDQLEQTVARRTGELRQTQLEIVFRLAKAAEFRDKSTGSHISRMSRYCEIIGRAIRLKPRYLELLVQAAPMHDIGKIGISDDILLKPARLTTAEYNAMKKHSEIGARLLSGHDSDLLRVARNIALTHHEKWDGSGYPLGLTGPTIPVAGRIAAICDVFDALVSPRPYKKPWSFDKAVTEIKNNQGRHFDPRLVKVFLQHLPAIKAVQTD